MGRTLCCKGTELGVGWSHLQLKSLPILGQERIALSHVFTSLIASYTASEVKKAQSSGLIIPFPWFISEPMCTRAASLHRRNRQGLYYVAQAQECCSWLGAGCGSALASMRGTALVVGPTENSHTVRTIGQIGSTPSGSIDIRLPKFLTWYYYRHTISMCSLCLNIRNRSS